MESKSIKILEKLFVRQQDQSDCGVACLQMALKYFEGNVSLEKLRELSGTTKTGTTMLGIMQGSEKVGIKADAFTAEPEHLRETDKICLLHVVIDKVRQHYVLFFGMNGEHFVISDPSKGVIEMTEHELLDIWQTKALLTLTETDQLEKVSSINEAKKSWILRLVQEDANILISSAFLGVLIASLGLSTAIFSQKLIDQILPAKDFTKLVWGLALLFTLLLGKSALEFFRGLMLNRQQRDFNNRIIEHFYTSLLRLPMSFFDNRKTGELVARMNDTQRIQQTISFLAGNVIIDALVLLVFTAVLFTYDLSVALIALASIPLYGALAYLYHKRILIQQQSVMASYAKNESNYIDTIQGIDSIKVANKEGLFSKVTKVVYAFYQEQKYQLSLTGIRLELIGGLIGVGLLSIILALGSIMVFDDTLMLGEFMAILQISGVLIPTVGRLSMTNVQLQSAKVAFDRMFEFTSVTPEYNAEFVDKNDELRSHELLSISIHNASFRFAGRKELLKNASLKVEKGSITALLGESGSGKSTVMKALQRFYNFESGNIQVELKGKGAFTWEDINTVTWRDRIAVVPQQVKLFPGTLLENVAMSENIEEEAPKVAKFCQEHGLERFIAQMPHGYATLLGEDGINISGGQRQIVALIRALYQQPQLLLLDEATAAMDKKTESIIMELLQQFKDQMGILFITHRMKVAAQCNHIFLLENGITQKITAKQLDSVFD